MHSNNLNIKQKTLIDAGGGNTPFVRAMFANVYLFGGTGFIIIEIFLRIANSINFIIDIVVISIGVFFIRQYLISVARIIISETSLSIILSLRQINLKREIIKSVEFKRLHFSNILKIKIYGNERRKKWVFIASTLHLKDDDIEYLKLSWLGGISTLNGIPLDSKTNK